MTTIDELMMQIPIAQLAGQLGVSEAEAEQAVRQALPALVGGLQANAADPAGAASLSQALSQHDGSLIDGGVDLDQVDTADGEKIVQNIFGDNEQAVVNQLGGGLGGLGGAGAGLIAKLLPLLAPMLMSYLGKSFGGGGGGGAGGGSAAPSAPSSSSGMGPGAAPPKQDSGGGLGDLLGGLLGGGGGGGLGDILGGLGGLLGGGKR